MTLFASDLVEKPEVSHDMAHIRLFEVKND